jgi:transketolase
MAQLALKAAGQLAAEGLACGVLHFHTVKPLDHAALNRWLPKVDGLVTVEEHTRIGGLGSAVLEFCSDEMPVEAAKVKRVGLPDAFADQYGSQNTLLDYFGVTVESLCDAMRRQLRRG